LRVRQGEFGEQLQRARSGLGTAEQAMDQRRFDHLIEQRACGIERCGGALRDIRHPPPAQRPLPGRRQRQHLVLAQPHTAAGDPTATARMAHQRQRGGGLARAGFPDQRQHLTGSQREIQIIDDDLLALRGIGDDAQPTHTQCCAHGDSCLQRTIATDRSTSPPSCHP
jgi:hypothetical protein